MTQAQEQARDKARKVFRHGTSTTARGEKEKAVAVLIGLCRKHHLVLYDLDPRFPRRVDIALLRAEIGLGPAPTAAPDAAHGPQPGSSGTSRSAGAAGSGASSAGERGDEKSETQDVLFREYSLAERQRRLQGAMFSQGILSAIRHTTADTRLMSELRSLNSSNVGGGMGEEALTGWYQSVLSRQGSSVPCKPTSRTIFDDLAAYCRTQYLTQTEQRRQAAQRLRAEEERRHAEETRREQAGRTAAQRRREEESRKARARQAAEEQRHTGKAHERKRTAEERGAADTGGPGPSDGVRRQPHESAAFTRTFEDRAEADLYLKVARRRVGSEVRLRSFSGLGSVYVEFSGSAGLRETVEAAYRQALDDLQLAASMIRAEAARVRENAMQQADAAYAQQCEQALQVAVDRYTA